MKNAVKQFIRLCVPKLFLDLLRAKDKTVYSGEYASWDDAEKLCSGYAQENILRKVAEATEKVVSGEAVFERDSMLFYHEEYNWPLVNALLKAAAENNDELCVLDFGGAMGSTYFQNRKQFAGIEKLKWCVVEQENFVKLGSEKFQTGELCFYKDIATCAKGNKLNVILFSSVLQYLSNPWKILKKAIDVETDYIILDRTLILENVNEDRLCIQKVPKAIYQASYPVWFFSRFSVEDCLNKKYTKTTEFDSISGKINLKKPHGKAFDKGFVFKKRDNA